MSETLHVTSSKDILVILKKNAEVSKKMAIFADNASYSYWARVLYASKTR